MLSAEDGPTWLGDAPVLGDTFLLDCERRFGTVPFAFDVLVAARDVCLSENLALLTQILNVEKPAHTTFRIRQTGAIGFVLGNSVIGQSVTKGFDRNELDPATLGSWCRAGRPGPRRSAKGSRWLRVAAGGSPALGGVPGGRHVGAHDAVVTAESGRERERERARKEVD